MKIPFEPTPDMNLHFMALKTDSVEWVGDDNLWLLNATVDNGDFNKEHKNQVQLKVLNKSAEGEALAYGGMAIFSNIKKSSLRKALLVGLDYMMRTGQLSKDDFVVTKTEE